MPEKDDLERELVELWRRVQGEEPEPFLPPEERPSSFSTRRYEAELQELRETLEAREKSAEGLASRLAAAEGELSRLRASLEHERDLFLEQLLKASSSLEEAQRSLAANRENRQREEAARQKRHQDELTAARKRDGEALEALKSEAEAAAKERREERARWEKVQDDWTALERKWRDAEAQLKAHVRELELERSKLQKALEAAEPEKKKLQERIARAEADLKGGADQLAAERRSALEAREGLERASAKVTELEGRLRELQAAWDEERKQWREMWDREHNAWESQRQEFESWEEKLRREREAWLETMRAKEAESAQAAARLGEALLGMAAQASGRVSRPVSRRSLAAAAAASGLLFLAASAYWFFASVRLSLESTQSAALKRPTALAASPDSVWIAEWDGGLVQAPASDPGRSRRFQLASPFHPLALAWSKEALWALDAASAGVFRLDPSEPLLATARRVTPAAALATAAAFDGRELWTYDAGARLLWRQSAAGGAARSVPLPEGVRPTSLDWSGADLWAYDAKAGILWRLALSEDRLRVAARLELPSRPLAASVSGKTLWTLEASGSDRYELKRWRLRP